MARKTRRDKEIQANEDTGDKAAVPKSKSPSRRQLKSQIPAITTKRKTEAQHNGSERTTRSKRQSLETPLESTPTTSPRKTSPSKSDSKPTTRSQGIKLTNGAKEDKKTDKMAPTKNGQTIDQVEKRGRPRKIEIDAPIHSFKSNGSTIEPSSRGRSPNKITVKSKHERSKTSEPPRDEKNEPKLQGRRRNSQVEANSLTNSPSIESPQKKSKPSQSRGHAKARLSSRIALRGAANSGRGFRTRKATTIYSPRLPEKRIRAQGKQPKTDRKPESENPQVDSIVRRVRNRLSNMRVHLAFIDAYEVEGWRQRNAEKLRPTNELISVRKKLDHSKRMILRELHEFIAEFAADTPLPKDASELDDDEIVCSKCGSTETQDENDIVLCDLDSCNRAYHQKCLEPPLTELPEDDDGWYCPRCEGIQKCLSLINSNFGEDWESLSEVFPDLDENDGGSDGSGEADDKNEANDVVDDDDDEEDEDFPDDENSMSSDNDSIESVSEDEVKYHKRTAKVLNASRRSMRSQRRQTNGEDDEEGSEDESDEEESLIVHGKRRRTVVDYRKLHGELFPNASMEEDDLEEYEPVKMTDDTDDEDDQESDNEDSNDDIVEITTRRGDQKRSPSHQDEASAGKRRRTVVNYRKLNGGQE